MHEAQLIAVSPGYVEFVGACDASGAVPIDDQHFAVADDEDNVLRIYDAMRGGEPLSATDVSPDLQVERKKRGFREADFEAATRVGDTAYWITSHARSKSGKRRPDRQRLFATTIPRVGQATTLRGRVYRSLLSDLIGDPRLRRFALDAAASRPPNVEGGLNLEGMTAMPDGGLLLGFRNPVPDGRALLLSLLDPGAPLRGERARFGEPITLDLAGLGVRSLSYHRGRYLIAAGGIAEGGPARVFEWRGPGTAPVMFQGVSLEDFNPEGFFTPETRDAFMLLSDDGARSVGAERCKDLDNPKAKRFRGLWVRLDEPPRAGVPPTARSGRRVQP